jgi:hypothetical protein
MSENENQTPPAEAPGPKLWERFADETPDAFSAFTVYLELGAQSSLSDVAEKTGRTYKAIRNLSSRHQWSERAAAWRQHLASASLAAIKHKTIKDHELWAARQQILREQEWERSQNLNIVCNQALNALAADPQAKISAYELSPLIRLTSQTARTAIAGVPDPNQGSEEQLDRNNDPLVRQFRSQAVKAVVAANPPPTPEIPQPQTQNPPQNPQS